MTPISFSSPPSTYPQVPQIKLPKYFSIHSFFSIMLYFKLASFFPLLLKWFFLQCLLYQFWYPKQTVLCTSARKIFFCLKNLFIGFQKPLDKEHISQIDLKDLARLLLTALQSNPLSPPFLGQLRVFFLQYPSTLSLLA